MTEALARHARERPSACALSDGRTSLTWDETKTWVDEAAGWLASLGLARGASVLGWLPNCLEWYLVRLACEQAGLFWVPVPSSQGLREMASIVERLQPAVLVAKTRFRKFRFSDEAGVLCARRAMAPIRVEVPEEGLLRLKGSPRAGFALRLEENAHALSTSGSEGIPKMAVYTLAAACMRAHAQADLLGLNVDDIVLALSPGTGPARLAWLAAPIAGSCVAALPQFGVDAAIDLIRRTRATIVCGTPSQLAILAPRLAQVDTSSIRIWYTAGSVLPPSLAEELEERTRAVVVSTYGGADFGGWSSARPEDSATVRQYTVGRPRGGTEFRIVDGEGNEVAPGEAGELLGRGPCCTTGFIGTQGAEAWRDGWFHTGDVASLREDGNVVIQGRMKEMIVRGGDKVSPIEVEALLRTHPDVAEAAVIAVPDAVLGERICACVVPAPSGTAPDLARLRSHLEALGLASYKAPERLLILQAMPVVGDKVNRRALAERCVEMTENSRCSGPGAAFDVFHGGSIMSYPSASGPQDMRSWIAQLDAAGELIRIDKPVDPLTEMGSLLYQSREKALLFEKLPHGWRSLGQAPANVRHAALAFGATEETVVPLVAERLGKLIKPQMVENAPVQELAFGKGEFDLTTFPVHVAGQRDGGPVLGCGLVVTKDPDTGQRNVSFHRLQIKGPNKSGILLYPRHTWKNYAKYQERNEPMPVAIFIGHHPLYYAAAATTAAYGLDEFEIAGGFLGEAVRLVKCQTVDLEVPADAEIVLEGTIPPHYREEEGPFSEFQDYYVTGTGKNPIVEYHHMTRRHDAIFKNLQNGSEMEGCVFHKIPMSAAIYRRLKDVGGGPNLHNVMVLPGIFGVVVQMTSRAYGEAKNLLLASLSSEYQHPKVAIAVDADVDIFNPAELLWALSTRVDPDKDVTIISGTHNHAMDASLTELGAPGTGLWQRFGSKMLIDATIPPPSDPEARAAFERIRPHNPQLRLEDFAADASLDIVRALSPRFFGSKLLGKS